MIYFRIKFIKLSKPYFKRVKFEKLVELIFAKKQKKKHYGFQKISVCFLFEKYLTIISRFIQLTSVKILKKILKLIKKRENVNFYPT